MDLNSGVNLGQLLLALVVLVLTGAVTWGALLQRVKTLEKEVEALSGFEGRLIRIEERSGHIVSELGKLTSSWLFREPPGYEDAGRPPPKPRSR